MVDLFGFFWSLLSFQKKIKMCLAQNTCWHLFGPFLNGLFWHMLKMLLKMDSKYTENAVWLKCISKQMHFKTGKSDVIKQTVSKQMENINQTGPYLTAKNVRYYYKMHYHTAKDSLIILIIIN